MHPAQIARRQQLRVPDTRTVADWIYDQRIQPPQGARGTQMDISLTPWLREPLEAIADNHNREVVVVGFTGGGKTTLLDASLLHITMEDPGSILLLMQNKNDADSYYDERAEPIIRALPGLGEIVRALPRGKRRKGELFMPHMTLYVQAANIANVQRKSVRFVMFDEAWQVNHGLIGEGRGRHHDRWNARVVLTSQGGWESLETDDGNVPTELFDAWSRTNQNEWCFKCPDCGTVQRWNFRTQLRWGTREEIYRKDGTLDEAALSESVRYHCQHEPCSRTFNDDITTRRLLADSGLYMPTNPNFLRKPGFHVGYRFNVLTDYRNDWTTWAAEWLNAEQQWAMMNQTPRIQFIQKRLAEFWHNPDDDPGAMVIGSGYCKADYMNGEKVQDEIHRWATMDRQRDHRWVVIRAWRADGSSRLLWEGKVLTAENCVALFEQMKIGTFVDPGDRKTYSFVFEDAQFETGHVYDECVKYGWTAMHGASQDGFRHAPPNRKPVKKFYSPRNFAMSPSGGRARYFHWAGDKVKDTLAILRDGKGASWETPDDASLDYRAQMVSEVKRDILNRTTKRPEQRWVKIGGRPNHMWDCEAMQVALAMIYRCINSPEENQLTTETKSG